MERKLTFFLCSFLLTLTLFANVYAIEQFGHDSTESGSQNTSNVISGTVFTCEFGGTVTYIKAYVKATYGTQKFRYAIYDTSGNLVGQTEEISVTTVNWYSANIVGSVMLTASTNYILTVWSNNGYAYLTSTGGSGLGRYKSQTYSSSGYPSTVSFSTDNYIRCIVCYYETAGGEEHTFVLEETFNIEDSASQLQEKQFLNSPTMGLTESLVFGEEISFGTTSVFGLATLTPFGKETLFSISESLNLDDGFVLGKEVIFHLTETFETFVANTFGKETGFVINVVWETFNIAAQSYLTIQSSIISPYATTGFVMVAVLAFLCLFVVPLLAIILVKRR